MKNYILLFVMSLVSFTIMAQEKQERYWRPNVEKIRIISYNILNGFENGKDTEREDRLAEWVKEKDPEIVMLQELCGFNQEKLERLAEKWGHRYALIVKEEGYPVGITSKKPIELKVKLVNGYGHGLLHAQTYGLNILATHLNPHDTNKRRAEAHNIIEYIRKENLDNVVLAGDMNSHSPMDAEYMEHSAIDLTAKYGGKESKNLLNGKLDYSVIATYMSYPLIDACQKYTKPEERFSYPTPILYSIPKNLDIRRKTNERLDYIFLSADLSKNLIEGFIWNGEDTEYLSDHFPIGIDLLLNTQKK